ncbi:methyltransferase [Methanobacterium lacus]|uniref:Methyltransferase n=1 Tax=Methanobacterium lacus (strain AL-21) TaxID=877455 RepID=F0T9G3_METLA|nr:methyltransferase [Methanobacterium lacus]
MEIQCGCGLGCVEKADTILNGITEINRPCENCLRPNLKKFKPLMEQMDLEELDANYGRCNCKKRHLDLVMGHVLKILIETGDRDKKSTLRNCCTPLITPAYPSNTAPYLSENSVVILTDKVTKESAVKIVKEVPEIKGVIRGDIKRVVGIKDANSKPNVYELLSGCDMRCDIVSTQHGPICIYRKQSQIHLEFSKPVPPKVQMLEKYLDKYENPRVMDCTCGPGTLGIASLKHGAKHVVFNDLWHPSIEMTVLNLEVNGFEVESLHSKGSLVAEGKNFKVYCADIMELKDDIDEKFDLCIVDTFPGVDNDEFVEAVSKICSEVVVI